MLVAPQAFNCVLVLSNYYWISRNKKGNSIQRKSINSNINRLNFNGHSPIIIYGRDLTLQGLFISRHHILKITNQFICFL